MRAALPFPRQGGLYLLRKKNDRSNYRARMNLHARQKSRYTASGDLSRGSLLIPRDLECLGILNRGELKHFVCVGTDTDARRVPGLSRSSIPLTFVPFRAANIRPCEFLPRAYQPFRPAGSACAASGQGLMERLAVFG